MEEKFVEKNRKYHNWSRVSTLTVFTKMHFVIRNGNSLSFEFSERKIHQNLKIAHLCEICSAAKYYSNFSFVKIRKILYFPIKHISMRVFPKFYQEQRVSIKNNKALSNWCGRRSVERGRKYYSSLDNMWVEWSRVEMWPSDVVARTANPAFCWKRNAENIYQPIFT